MKLYLLILVFAVTTVHVSGQTFAPLGATWHYNSNGEGLVPPGSEYYLYQSKLDTLISGKTCKKISVSYYRYNGTIVYPPPVFTYQSHDTVFYYNKVYSRYFPLYIFNVSAGDTITYHSPDIPFNAADTLWKSVVDSVTNFVAGGATLRRVWTREPYPSAYSFWGGYIEKIGSPFLMLHQPHSIHPEWDGPLRCYSDSSTTAKFTTKSCDYRLFSGIDEATALFGLSLYPNPARHELNIRLKDRGPYQLQMYNSLGQLVKTALLSAELTTFRLDEFHTGLYSIELRADDSVARKSFLIE